MAYPTLEQRRKGRRVENLYLENAIGQYLNEISRSTWTSSQILAAIEILTSKGYDPKIILSYDCLELWALEESINEFLEQ